MIFHWKNHLGQGMFAGCVVAGGLFESKKLRGVHPLEKESSAGVKSKDEPSASDPAPIEFDSI